MTTFTASEVRERAAILHSRFPSDIAEGMLHAYADRIEADEKAVPVCWAKEHNRETLVSWSKESPEFGKGGWEPLYTHPPRAADAERLAEALRKVQSWSIADETIDDEFEAESCEVDAALAAYDARCAQAQPPVASVPGELAEPLEGVLNYEQELSFAEGWNACRKAMLAAQENPNG